MRSCRCWQLLVLFHKACGIYTLVPSQSFCVAFVRRLGQHDSSAAGLCARESQNGATPCHEPVRHNMVVKRFHLSSLCLQTHFFGCCISGHGVRRSGRLCSEVRAPPEHRAVLHYVRILHVHSIDSVLRCDGCEWQRDICVWNSQRVVIGALVLVGLPLFFTTCLHQLILAQNCQTARFGGHSSKPASFGNVFCRVNAPSCAEAVRNVILKIIYDHFTTVFDHKVDESVTAQYLAAARNLGQQQACMHEKIWIWWQHLITLAATHGNDLMWCGLHM